MYRPSEDKLEHLNWGQGGRGGGEWHAEDDMKMITSSGLSKKNPPTVCHAFHAASENRAGCKSFTASE